MILGISGRKQSGKSTTGNFVFSLKLAELGVCENIQLDDQGRIGISDLFGDKNYAGILDLSKSKLAEYSNPLKSNFVLVILSVL